jgi:hypothetical protein
VGARLDAMQTRTRPDPAGVSPAFRSLTLLVAGYLGLSVLTLVAAALLDADPELVTDAVWVRGTIVVISAAVMAASTRRAARGSRRAFRRVRILAAAMVVAIIVIIAVPGSFPTWMKLEQAVCGLLLVGVVALTGGRRLRSVFAPGAAPASH